MILSAIAIASSMHACPLAFQDDVRFADMAPQSSMLVIAADDLAGMISKFEKSPLHGICEVDAVKEMMADTFGNAAEAMAGMDGDFDPSRLMSAKSLGFSIYVDLDEETGQSRAFVLGYGDWGDESDNTQAAIDMMFDQGRKAGMLELDEREVRGREVKVVTTIEVEGDDADDFDNFDQMMMFGDPSTMLPNMDTMYVVRDGSRFMFANDLIAIDDALAVLDGDGGESVRDARDWQEITGMLGDPDVYLVMRFAPLGELMAPMMMGPLGMAEPMMDEFFGGMEGIGATFDVAGDASALGMIESRVAVYAPGDRAGFMSLMNNTSPMNMVPPKMIPADVTSFSRMNMEFKDIIPMVRDMTAAMPMGGEEIENNLDMFEPSIKPALDTLGPEIYIFSSFRKPMAADSASTVAIVPAAEPDRVHPLLATVGPSMGLEPRDFKGETIWSDDLGGGSLAVAGNWMIVGDARGVEQTIRAMSGDAESIRDNRIFENSVARMPGGDVVGWGWSDTVEQYTAQRESFKQMMEMMGGFDEFAPEVQAGGQGSELLIEFFNELSPDDISAFVGPGLWTVTAPENGWLYKVWMLPPTKQAG